MSKKITTKKICTVAKNQPVHIVAIDVSPLKIMDQTPEQVVKMSQGNGTLAVKGKGRGKEVTGISDFNPLELIESTDKSRYGGVRDSNQTRLSRSCLPSPTHNDCDTKFRLEVDKFLNGYSVIYSNEGHSSDDHRSNFDNEGRQARSGADRYSVYMDMECENPEVAFITNLRDSQPFSDGVQTLRRSKSYDKDVLAPKQPQNFEVEPSGPQYNIKVGGKVVTQKVGTPQNLGGQATINKNLKRYNSLYKLNKLESLYTKGQQQRLQTDIGSKLTDLQKNEILSKLMKPVQQRKKTAMSSRRLTSLPDSGTSSHTTSKKNSFKKGCQTKALTTGYKTSEGTEPSRPQSPTSQTRYSEFAQTAYTFEMKNAMKQGHGMQVPQKVGYFSPNDTQICSDLEQVFPQIQVNATSRHHKAHTQMKPSYPKHIGMALTNQPSKASFIPDRIPSDLQKQFLQKQEMMSTQKKYESNPALKKPQHLQSHLQKEIDRFKQRIFNANQMYPIGHLGQQLPITGLKLKSKQATPKQPALNNRLFNCI